MNANYSAITRRVSYSDSSENRYVPLSHISTPIHTNLHHSCPLLFTPIAPTLKRCSITEQ